MRNRMGRAKYLVCRENKLTALLEPRAEKSRGNEPAECRIREWGVAQNIEWGWDDGLVWDRESYRFSSIIPSSFVFSLYLIPVAIFYQHYYILNLISFWIFFFKYTFWTADEWSFNNLLKLTRPNQRHILWFLWVSSIYLNPKTGVVTRQ